jgi:L-malate glycosyltransferase
MKKIIFIHLLNDYSGSPKVLSQVIKACSNEGYEIELYTSKSEEGFLSNLTVSHSYYYKWFRNKYLTLFSFLFSQCLLFFKVLKHRNEDVIFYINTMLPFGAALAGKLMNKPIYYHIHEISIKPQSLKSFLRGIIKLTSSRIIFVSNAVKVSEHYKFKEEYVIYNGLSNEFVNQSLTFNYSYKTNDYFNVLMVSSLKSYKGIMEFITIAKQLVYLGFIKFTLVVNAQQYEIDFFFNNIKTPTNMKIISRQKTIIPFYKNASLVLNLSRVDEWIETFGLTILEAMAFGIPVIVPPIGGPVEIVTNGLEGYLISSYKVKSIAKKIIELSRNEQKCMELSKNARLRSLDFNEEAFKKQILKVLNA